MKPSKIGELLPLSVAILTVTDSRTAAQDSSGDLLAQLATDSGHSVLARALCANNRYAVRAILSQWIASTEIQVVLINGGTGFSDDNCTPEAIAPLFDRPVEGFGELFRALSLASIGSSAMQSRALAGLANGTLVFAVPGSGNACKLAWQELIVNQIDNRTGPCNFVAHLKNSPQPACR